MRCLIIGILAIAALLSSTVLMKERARIAETRTREPEIREIIEEMPKERGEEKGDTAFQRLKEANPDLRALLVFDSGIIRLPVVQSEEPEYYLRRNFYKEDSPEGVPFFDSGSQMDDTNMIIYGHHVYYDESAQFTPLAKLTDQQFYERNNRFSLIFEDETREYVITHVYILTLDEYQDYDYRQLGFPSEEEWDSWIALPDEKNLVVPEERLAYGDRFVTLQTCRAWQEDTRIIVLAKEKAESHLA